jgi:hypothetical protein
MQTSEAVAPVGHNNPPEPTMIDRLKEEFFGLMDELEALAKAANAAKAIVDQNGLKSDEDVAPLVKIGKDATKMAKRLDEIRLQTSQPLRDDVERINGFFNMMKARAEAIKNAFAKKVGEYDAEKRERERREAAERARVAEEAARAKLEEAAAAQHSVMGDVVMNEAAELEQHAALAASEATKAGTGPMRTEFGTVSSSGKWTFAIDKADDIPLEKLRPYIKIADLEKFVRAFVAAKKNTEKLPGVRIFQEQKTSFR